MSASGSSSFSRSFEILDDISFSLIVTLVNGIPSFTAISKTLAGGFPSESYLPPVAFDNTT